MPIDQIVADAIDRAITIEMRFAGGLPRGVTEPLYRAAREHHGGLRTNSYELEHERPEGFSNWSTVCSEVAHQKTSTRRHAVGSR